MRAFILTSLCIATIFVVYVCRPSARQTAHSAPAPTASTAAPITYPTPGASVRVNFPVGSYGMPLFAQSSTRYLLWARQGQALKVAVVGDATLSLYAPDGNPLFENVRSGGVVSATLTADGDQALVIMASKPITVGVEIR
jgi:hypothetical protein